MKYSVVDLFAGAGGLSLGFQQTGKFDIKVAAENNKHAKATYKRNHGNTKLLDDVCTVDYQDIVHKHGPIDVVIGGPPCQGFSNANRQKNHAISSNNRLVKEYVKAVCGLQPKVFVMENVDMLRSETHRFYYSEEDEEIIDSLDIELKECEIELLPLSISLNNIEKLIGDYEKLKIFNWDEKTYSTLNILYKQNKNPVKFKDTANRHKKSLEKIGSSLMQKKFSDEEICKIDYILGKAILDYLEESIDSAQLLEKLETPIAIQKMISKLKELEDNKIRYVIDTEKGVIAKVQAYAVIDYIRKLLENNNYIIKSGVLNALDFGVPQKRMRFIMIGVKSENELSFELPKGTMQGKDIITVRDAIGDLESINPAYEVAKPPISFPLTHQEKDNFLYRIRDSEFLHNHVITKTRETALKRFAVLKEGQNFHDLKTEMIDNTYTNAKRTQNTIYLRLKYDEPSGTVVNVRKSMWIHPTIDRALSIREAARLQTFPDSFVFEGTKDMQYQQVGNAVPPILANAIARKVLELMEELKQDN